MGIIGNTINTTDEMNLNELRVQYIRAKEHSNKPDYWKQRLVEALQKAISYSEGAEKASLRKELFNLQ